MGIETVTVYCHLKRWREMLRVGSNAKGVERIGTGEAREG